MRFYGVFSTFLFSIILFFKIIRTFLELSTSLNRIPSIRQIGIYHSLLPIFTKVCISPTEEIIKIYVPLLW